MKLIKIQGSANAMTAASITGTPIASEDEVLANTQTISPVVRASLAWIAEEMRARSRSLNSITSSPMLRRRRKSLHRPRTHHHLWNIHRRRSRPIRLPARSSAC